MTTVKLSLLSGLQQLRLPEDGHCQAADERMRVYTYYIFSKMLEKIRTFQLNQFNQTLFFTYKALSLCTKCLLESAVHLFTLTERKRLPAGLISWLRYIQPPPAFFFHSFNLPSILIHPSICRGHLTFVHSGWCNALHLPNSKGPEFTEQLKFMCRFMVILHE